jgi:hypothetical protein
MDMNIVLTFVHTAIASETDFHQVMGSQLSAALVIIFGLLCLKAAAKEQESRAK